jgi:hypothetical protein
MGFIHIRVTAPLLFNNSLMITGSLIKEMPGNCITVIDFTHCFKKFLIVLMDNLNRRNPSSIYAFCEDAFSSGVPSRINYIHADPPAESTLELNAGMSHTYTPQTIALFCCWICSQIPGDIQGQSLLKYAPLKSTVNV